MAAAAAPCASAGRTLLLAAFGVSPKAQHAVGSLAMRDPEEADEEDSPSTGLAVLRIALAWSPLGRRRDDAKVAASDPGGRSFEIADLMEQGLARETTTDFTTPLKRSSRLFRFRVVRSADHLEARLMSEAGEFMMYARVHLEQRRVAFFLYDPGGEDSQLYDPDAPAFSMGFDATHTEWRLVQERCQHCQMAPSTLSCASRGGQQIAFMRHARVPVGDGVSNHMEVWIPGIYSDGNPVVWCPQLRGHSLEAAGGAREHEVQRLVTRAPSWNPEVESLVLDFTGRNVVASAKNFQLALRQKPGHVLCQFGKLGNSNFGLDFRYPLSVAQAFGMAMSTAFWK